jgi:hypothetical protein
MASTNTGIFASSFIEGFLGKKEEQEERKKQEKIIKLQTQLIEQQLSAGKIKLDAQTTLSDILTGRPAIDTPGDVGPGEFGPPKSRSGREPLPLAELLTNPEALNAAFQSGQLNLKDLLGGQDQATTLQKNVRAAGFQPGTQPFQDQMLSLLDAGADDDALAQLVFSQQQEKLDEQRRERVQFERTEKEERIGRQQAVRNDFSNAKRIIELQQDLEGTALAAGIPYGDFLRDIGAGGAALAGVLGFDLSAAQAAVAKRDELAKLFADNTIEAIDRFKGTGAITNQKFDALVAASPEIGKTAIANAKVLAGRMRAVLDAAERKGEIIPNRAEIEAWIQEMKGLSPGATTPVVDVPAISKLTIQELSQLNLQGMGEDALRAAAKRWEELSGR